MKKRMTLKQFIRKFKNEINEHILNACPEAPLNDTERELWVLNDEMLRQWARSEGARI